jgi:uncharacterized protein
MALKVNKIMKEILTHLPQGKVNDISFEAANIVLYTKDKEFLKDSSSLIRSIVNSIKKRVELRPDPSITMGTEEAEKEIKKILPKESGIAQIIFDEQRSRVIIEVEKPGIAIGKQGSLLREIKEKTWWVPHVRRTPPIRSKLIENIRLVLYQNSDYRRKFLDKTGHRIYDGWKREKQHEWIRLSYLGGARQVGRSCLFMQTPESRVLLDCGVNVAVSNNDMYPFLEAPEFNIADLDAVIVSHAHMDHVGMIPYLFKYGYRGPVYCTAPTRDVMALLTLDMIKIQRMEGKEPIYSSDDVKEMVKHTVIVNYESVTDVTPDVRITMYKAGHIIGSAMVHMNIGNGLHNLLYTGDIKFGPTNLLDPTHTRFPRLETMMIESTYGGKGCIGKSKKDSETEFSEIITSTINGGGQVLIPVLGVGRAQEVMLSIHQLVKEGKIPEIPVHVDGMVWDVTAIHSAYPEFLNARVRKQIFHDNENPFLAPIFSQVGSMKERKQIMEQTGPCIILATSGMLTGGPSVQYLKHMASNPKNTLIFVCYQGEGCLGRRVQRGEKEIIFQTGGGRTEAMHIKLRIATVGFSGHSDRRELMSFIGKCQPRPRKIMVNHGDVSRCLDFASAIHQKFRIETSAPKNLETVRIK